MGALDKETFTLPSGATVELRGVSGFEWMLTGKKGQSDQLAAQMFFLGCGLGTDEGGAEKWAREHVAGDTNAVADRIRELSGLSEDATKSSVDPDGGDA